MCRMIAAVGRFSMSDLVSAVRVMAQNAAPGHEHELSPRGPEFRHDSGWGALYVSGGRLVRVRSTVPCFDDPRFDALASVETELAIVHARRAKNLRTISGPNTHPFLAVYRGEEWAFCHNGEVRDLSQLSWDPALAPEGSTDSEKLFLHLLTALGGPAPAGAGSGGPPGAGDGSAVPAAVCRTLAAIEDFTCVNCFLARRDSIVAATRYAPGSPTPRYYTMWSAGLDSAGDGCAVVSSEPIRSMDVAWQPVEDGSVLLLTRPARRERAHGH